jgi:hypothetical protein
MIPSIRRRTDASGFEAGPNIVSYRYGVSIDPMLSSDEQPYGCREFTFINGGFRSYRIGRAGAFYEIAFGKPGDPIPTVEVTDIECPNG